MILDNDLVQILHLLQENEYIPSAEMAVALSKTNRTIRSYLTRLNEILLNHGARIETEYGKGSHLIITDHEDFRRFAESEGKDQADQKYFLKNWVLQDQPVFLDSLEEEFFLTRKQIRKECSDFSRMAGWFELELVSRPHAGTFLRGKEWDRRMLLLWAMERDICSCREEFARSIGSPEFDWSLLEEWFSRHPELDPTDRERFGWFILMDEMRKTPCEVSGQRTDHLQPRLNLILPDFPFSAGRDYLFLALKSQYYEDCFSQEQKAAIRDTVKEALRLFGMELSDEEFEILGCKTLYKLLFRDSCHAYLGNPFSSQLALQDLWSCEAAREVLYRLNLKVPEDEAVRLAVSLEKILSRETRRLQKAYIVYPEHSLERRWIRSMLEENNPGWDFEFLSPSQAEGKNLEEENALVLADSYASVFRRQEVPVLDFSSPIKLTPYHQCRYDLESYFRPDTFHYRLEIRSQKELFRFFQEDPSYGSVWTEAVRLRDSVFSSVCTSASALLWAADDLAERSSLSVIVLKSSADWNGRKVRILFALRLQKETAFLELRFLMRGLTKILQDPLMENRIIRTSIYEALLESLKTCF